jgi:uncharacterized protein
LDVVRKLSPNFRTLAAEHGCAYSANLTTNGYTLSNDVAEELINQHGIDEIQITFDGDRPFHDRTRIRHGGGPTFDVVFQNLVQVAHRYGLAAGLVVRCNVTKDNNSSVPDLISRLAGAGLQKVLKTVYFAPIHDWGNDAGCTALPPEVFAKYEIEWFVALVEAGFHPVLLPKRVEVNCLAVKRDGFVVDPFGNLYNCPEPPLVTSPPRVSKDELAGLPVIDVQTEAAYYRIGSVDGDYAPDRRLILGRFNDLVGAGERPCATCPVLPVCGGACPKHWLQGHPPCPSFKLNLSDRLLVDLGQARYNSVADTREFPPTLDMCNA